jgi:putative ABC transport system permease protein
MRTYFKLALKVLGRRKFFTFISLFGITLTLVVLVVAAAILDNFFTPQKPESRFDRVLCVYRAAMTGHGSTQSSNAGYRLIHDYVFTLPGIEAASAFSQPQTVAIYRGSGKIDAKVRQADAQYWRILDFQFLEGRPYSAREDEDGALVAVISDTLRRKLFEGTSAAGKTLELDGRTFRIVGVVPSVPITRVAAHADVWVPITTSKSSDYRHQMLGGFNGIVLLRNRSDAPRLKREFDTRMKRVPFDDPKTYTEWLVGLDTPFEAFARDILSGPGVNKLGGNRAAILRTILGALALLFMSLPALNLVTLNLSRILERAPEIGVRKAFGASRGALVRQFVLENIVLTSIGGAIAFVLAFAAMPLLNRSSLIPDAQFAVNPRVFLYGMAIAVVFGAFSGLYPAWRMSRLNPVDALRGGAQ